MRTGVRTAAAALFAIAALRSESVGAQAQLPVLPPPAPAVVAAPEAAVPSPSPSPPASTITTTTTTATPAPAAPPVSAPASVPEVARPPAGAFRLAIQTEGAIGVSGPFYNQLVGARLDRCFAPATCLGGYIAYANLKGQSGRASNVLLYAMVEHRRRAGLFFIPLRVATGYLPHNGPIARASAGIGIESGNIDVTFDLLAPTLWVTGNEPVVSMDLAAEVAVRF
jgi:hypothetical protein